MMTTELVESSIPNNMTNPKEHRQSLRLKFQSINLPGKSILYINQNKHVFPFNFALKSIIICTYMCNTA